jgi:hypothetical protein
MPNKYLRPIHLGNDGKTIKSNENIILIPIKSTNGVNDIKRLIGKYNNYGNNFSFVEN